jgi:hypothetical protein
MQPLTVDTVFSYGGGIVDAALGGTTLPAGEASIVWTVTGGFETLLDAQAGLTVGDIGLNWGNPFIPHDAILNNWNGSGSPEIALADNRITLDLGKQAAKAAGSANFNLEYLPFGAGDMKVFQPFVPTGDPAATGWIIRNGVNDLAQDSNTTFPNTVSTVSPWNKDTANGNGAVAFEFVPEEISHIDLTGLVPAPVMGAEPVTETKEGLYKQAAITWKATGGKLLKRFEGETIYSARVTLEAGTGFLFRTLAKGGVTVAHGGSSGILYITKTDTTVVADVLFPRTGAVWEYGGYFSGSSTGTEIDSAIDVIGAAQAAGFSSLSLNLLLPWPETLNLSASDTDIKGDLKLDNTNSPAEVILDGDGREISLTAGNTGSVITVGSGVTLTLRNITFKGSDANNAPLIKVEAGGKLVLEDGAVITGNKNTANNGGGVYVDGGTLVMTGGTISGNTATSGGGVYMDFGVFTMNGGTISGNITTSTNDTGGGGVYVSGGSFTMKNGEISKNNSGKWGGGVYVNGSGEFTMSGGTISGNNATSSGGGVSVNDSGVFTMSGGSISGNTNSTNGGGVHMNGSGVFTMSGGTISDNKTNQRGGGVALYSQSKFTMNGGIISGNKNTGVGYGGGVYVNDDYPTFIKRPADGGPFTSGVIYGNDAAPSLQNTASKQGQAVGVGANKGWNKTVDENTDLSSSNTSGGGWEAW